jgi:hypothetical protein
MPAEGRVGNIGEGSGAPGIGTNSCDCGAGGAAPSQLADETGGCDSGNDRYGTCSIVVAPGPATPSTAGAAILAAMLPTPADRPSMNPVAAPAIARLDIQTALFRARRLPGGASSVSGATAGCVAPPPEGEGDVWCPALQARDSTSGSRGPTSRSATTVSSSRGAGPGRRTMRTRRAAVPVEETSSMISGAAPVVRTSTRSGCPSACSVCTTVEAAASRADEEAAPGSAAAMAGACRSTSVSTSLSCHFTSHMENCRSS